MTLRGLLLVLLLVPTAAGQMAFVDGPAVTVVIHHPNDGVDPFGFPWGHEGGYFVHRYARFDADRDGFGYPTVVIDGQEAIEGLPDLGAPQDTRIHYEDAMSPRRDQDANVTIEVATRVKEDGGRITGRIALLGEADLLWVVVIEDHVHYQPPAAISNGVTDHRFTARHVERHNGSGLTDINITAGDWDMEQVYLAVWAERDGEVVQATTHPVTQTDVTRQRAKGVLLEMLSATWCDPCLHGDRAVEEIADDFGHPHFQTAGATGPKYWAAPPWYAYAFLPLALLLWRRP